MGSSHHSSKFGGHKHSGSGYVVFFCLSRDLPGPHYQRNNSSMGAPHGKTPPCQVWCP